MFSNFLSIAFRNLIKERISSFINIVGLTISIMVSILIVQYAAFEFSYDKFHDQAENIYRVYLNIGKELRETKTARVSPAVGLVFKNEFPEIEQYTRMVILGPDGVLTYNNRFTAESTMLLADSSFFDLFSFELLKGDRKKALTDPFCVVMTESSATSIFGQEDPIGKEVIINAQNFDGTSIPFKVTGVLADFPENSHLHPGVLISYPTLFEFVGHQFDESWTWNETYTYVKLNRKVDSRRLENKFSEIVEKKNPRLAEQQLDWVYKLQPITDVHLYSNLKHEISSNGNALHVYILLGIGFFVLLIAYINYLNLMLVKAMQRIKEVGVRKVSGAYRRQIVVQFFSEAILLNGIAVLFAIIGSALIKPWLTSYFTITFSNEFVVHQDLWLVFVLLLLTLIVVSGIYPSILLSRYSPAFALKSGFSQVASTIFMRKALVVGQFSIAMIVVSLTLAAFIQVRNMQEQPLGFNPDQIVMIKAAKAHNYGYGDNFKAFQSQINSIRKVQSISAANVIPGEEIHWYNDQVEIDGAESSTVFSVIGVDPNYFTHYEIPIVAGRHFLKADERQKWIINESSAKALGFDRVDAVIGRRLNGNEIIGVVKDFHHQSLKDPVTPLIFTTSASFNYYSVKIEMGELSKTLAQVEALFTKLFPGSPYEFFFLDEFFNRQYRSDLLFSRLFSYLSGISILLACLGLYGLSSYMTFIRTKEIGIRKVVGASAFNVVVLLTKDFAKLILIAGLISLPMAYTIVERWLGRYAFRIDLSWWLLIVPVFIIFVAAILVISVQTIRAAMVNPVNCLKNY